MRTSFLGALLATLSVACPGPVVAEDIDLFVQPAGAAGTPNILILLDNTANWSKTVQGQAIYINEIKALKAQFASLQSNPDGTAKFRVGLMLFTEAGGGKAPTGNKGNDGGYIRAAIRDMNEANRGIYVNLLASLNETADKSNGGKAGKAFWEAYQYFAGFVPYAGNQKAKSDYAGNTFGTAASKAVYGLAGNALAAYDGSPYISPIPNGNCGNNYLIYISNGKAQDNASDTSTATTALAAAATADGVTNATSPISLTPSGSASNVADEWARFMVNSSKKITSYALDVDSGTSPSEQGWTRLLKSVAGDDPTRYYAVTAGDNGASIADALNDIFTKIQSVNSVFASVSLPVSVSTQGTYLNQVFIGMFRPDKDALPRWAGNLKQYKLAFTDTSRTLLKTVDSRDNPYTINSGTGFIDKCAQTYWTPAWNGTRDTVWSYQYPDSNAVTTAERAGALFCSSMPIPPWGVTDVTAISKLGSAQSNTPDGNFVEKGAQGYKLRSSTSRVVRTCSGDCSGGLVDFNASNVSQSDLGAANSPDPNDTGNLISWATGLDVADEDADGVTTTEMRPSAHGDVVHSRPVAINFGTEPVYPFDPAADGPRVVVFYGGNDGVLRAINGNRGSVGTNYGRVAGVDAGAEFWSFIPPEFYSKIKPLKVNDTEVAYQNTTAIQTQPKPYGIDGPITSYRNGTGVGDPAWIFAAMRRGGRAVYAFDVTDIAADSLRAPTLKWKAGCPGLGCTGALSDIGQTWSAPRVIKAEYNSGAPLVIMGGGYDACQDADPNNCSGASTGDHIYVLDAATGAHLKTLDTDSQVVGDVVMSSDPSTGYVRWGYAADMGGNVYRISGATANTPIGDTNPTGWTITKIASLGCSTPRSFAALRKFMFAPSVVYDNGTYWIMLGSGDREKPLRTWPSAYGTTNHFFAFKDIPDQASWLTSEAANCGNTAVLCLNSLVSVALNGGDPSDTDLSTKKGWYLGLNQYEQVVTTAVTVFQITTFSTHTPVPAGGPVCGSNLGTARVYNVDYTNAHPKPGKQNRSDVIAGGGLPPSPVAGMVRLDEGGAPVPFLVGGDKDSPLQGLMPTGVGTHAQPKAVTYWYIHK